MTTLLDTRAVPASDRADYWTAGIAEHFFPMGVESVGPRPFEARLTGGEVGCRHGALDRRPAAQRPADRADGRRGRPGLLPALPAAQRIVPDRAGRSLLRAGPGRSLAPGHLAAVLLRVARRPRCGGVQLPEVAAGRAGQRDQPADGDEESRSGTESVVRLGTPFLAALARTVEREPVSEREAEGLSDMLVGMLWALHGDQRRRSRCGDASGGTAGADAPVCAGAPARSRAGARPDRPRALRVHAVRAQAVRGSRLRGGRLGARAAARAGAGRSAPVERCLGRLRRSPVGIPRPGQLQSRVPADLRLLPARAAPAAADADPARIDGARVPTAYGWGKPAWRKRVPQMPDFPGAMMPLGSSVSLSVSLNRRCAWSLKPNWSAARSMKDRWARYSP